MARSEWNKWCEEFTPLLAEIARDLRQIALQQSDDSIASVNSTASLMDASPSLAETTMSNSDVGMQGNSPPRDGSYQAISTSGSGTNIDVLDYDESTLVPDEPTVTVTEAAQLIIDAFRPRVMNLDTCKGYISRACDEGTLRHCGKGRQRRVSMTDAQRLATEKLHRYNNPPDPQY